MDGADGGRLSSHVGSLEARNFSNIQTSFAGANLRSSRLGGDCRLSASNECDERSHTVEDAYARGVWEEVNEIAWPLGLVSSKESLFP